MNAQKFTKRQPYCLTFLFAAFFYFPLYSQAPHSPECHVETGGQTESFTGSEFGPFGLTLTPKDTLRALIVFAGFEGFAGALDEEEELIGPPLSDWENLDENPDFQLPSYLTFENGVVKTSPMFFNDYDDFDPQGSIMEDSLNRLSVSNILNMMSKPNEDFKFIGEVFTNPQGEPVLVTIDFATGSENVTPLTFHTQNPHSHSKLLSSLLPLS